MGMVKAAREKKEFLKLFISKRARALLDEGQRLHRDGKLEAAVDRYTKSIRMYPTAEAYTFRAWAFGSQKKLERAIAECKRAIELDPDYGNPYNDIGSYLIAQGELDEAIGWLERAKHAPRYGPRHFPYMNLGRVYTAKGLVLRAIREFETALEHCPGEPFCVAAVLDLYASLDASVVHGEEEEEEAEEVES